MKTTHTQLRDNFKSALISGAMLRKGGARVSIVRFGGVWIVKGVFNA